MSETLESPKPKAETHKTMGGKVNIYRRENSDNWQCSTFLNGRNWRVSTHEDSLGRAKDFAAAIASRAASFTDREAVASLVEALRARCAVASTSAAVSGSV